MLYFEMRIVIVNYRSNNSTKTDFDTSIIMTTYLVALVISDFHCLNQTIENMGEYGKVDVRVCSRPDAVANGYLNYSLQTTVKIIKDLENFYGVKYSLPKCDSVALPDFSFGAMGIHVYLFPKINILIFLCHTRKLGSYNLQVCYMFEKI
jgi:aminopeptidase N